MKSRGNYREIALLATMMTVKGIPYEGENLSDGTRLLIPDIKRKRILVKEQPENRTTGKRLLFLKMVDFQKKDMTAPEAFKIIYKFFKAERR